MTTGASTDCPKSESNFCNQIISHATIVAPLYSAFVLDNATVGCFQWMKRCWLTNELFAHLAIANASSPY
jgi:hypothetical protein